MRQGKGNSGSVGFDHRLIVWFISILSTEDSAEVSRHSGQHHFTAFSYYMKSERSSNFQQSDHQFTLRECEGAPALRKYPHHLGRQLLLKRSPATAQIHRGRHYCYKRMSLNTVAL